MRTWWWLLVGGLTVDAQYFELEGADIPSAHALATVARFFIWAVDDLPKPAKKSSADATPLPSHEASGDLGYTPSPGWGFWDSDAPREARILARDISYHFGENAARWLELSKQTAESRSIVESSAPHAALPTDGLHLDLAIMPYNDFWDVFVPYQQTHHFCCTKADISQGVCDGPGFLLPTSLRNNTFVTPVPINRAYGTVIDAEMQVEKSGIYYAVLVNCGRRLDGGTFSGSLVARGSYGYLSGIDTPKLQLYFWSSVACLTLSVIWVAWCVRYRRQIILLHTYVGLVIAVYFLEQILFYTQLSWSNAMSQPSMVMKCLALLASVSKNVLTAGLILVTCLGLSITKPSLDGQTKAKVVASIVVLTILDAERQIATHFHISYDFSIALMLLCALPITVLYTIGFMWCFRSLHVLLEELRARRQTAKLRQMTRYRAVLVVAAVLFMVATVIESYVLSMDIQRIWPYEWIFTDALPVLLYMFVVVLTAMIWRPHRSSKYYSYNVQLGDEEEDIEKRPGELTWNSPHGTELEIRPWGEVELEEEEASAEAFKPFEVTSTKQ